MIGIHITTMSPKFIQLQATLEELGYLLIPTERLRLVERSLGSGNYGEVVLGTLDETSPTPRDVAVKRLKAVGTRGERIRLAKVSTA